MKKPKLKVFDTPKPPTDGQPPVPPVADEPDREVQREKWKRMLPNYRNELKRRAALKP